MLDKVKSEQWKEGMRHGIGLMPGPAPGEWIKRQEGSSDHQPWFRAPQCHPQKRSSRTATPVMLHPNLLLHLNTSLTLKSLWCVLEGTGVKE